MSPAAAKFTEILSGEIARGTDKSPFTVANRLTRLGGRLMRDHGCEHVEAIVEAIEEVYTKHVAPIDIPIIPNVVEPAFDAAVLNAILIAIRFIGEKLCDDDSHDDSHEE